MEEPLESSRRDESSEHPAPSPQAISQVALEHYNWHLPSNQGKPQAGREWTVYAAVLAAQKHKNHDDDHDDDNKTQSNYDLWVLSCATGSKCCNVDGVSSFKAAGAAGGILHDSHAEVLARRGLMRYLWGEIQLELQSLLAKNRGCVEQSRCCRRRLLEVIKTPANGDETPVQFALRSGVTLHMYISDSPCGDASIYALHSAPSKLAADTSPQNENLGKMQPHASTTSNNNTLNFTGAKIIISKQPPHSHNIGDTGGIATIDQCGGDGKPLLCTTSQPQQQQSPQTTQPSQQPTTSTTPHTVVATVAREGNQLLSKLRTKAGRSNLPSHLRSFSMSCSDKLCRWGIWGMQGGFLSRFLLHPLRLSSLCVGRDPRAAAARSNSLTVRSDAVCNTQQGGQWEALYRAVPARIQKTLQVLQDQVQQTIMQGDMQQQEDENNKRMQQQQLQLQMQQVLHHVVIPEVHVVDCVFEHGKSATAWKEELVLSAAAAAGGGGVGAADNSCVTVMEQTFKKEVDKKEGPHQDPPKKRHRGDSNPNPNTKHNPPVLGEMQNTKTYHKTNKKKKKHFSPCGLSLNWQYPQPQPHTLPLALPHSSHDTTTYMTKRKQNTPVEQTVGATGQIRGKKPKTMVEWKQGHSRLSRRRLLEEALRCERLMEQLAQMVSKGDGQDGDGDGSSDLGNGHGRAAGEGLTNTRKPTCRTYQELKEAWMSTGSKKLRDLAFLGQMDSCGCQAREKQVSCHGPLTGWVRSCTVDDFLIENNGGGVLDGGDVDAKGSKGV